MMELPEAVVLANQLNSAVKGNKIEGAQAALWPHKFAFYAGDPATYGALLEGKTWGAAKQVGGYIKVDMENVVLMLGEGVVVRLYRPDEKEQGKSVMRITLEDGIRLTFGVQMYGGLWAFRKGTFENPYMAAAKEKPSPLSEQFDKAYFEKVRQSTKSTLSAKAFLATEQRVPGLGNGVLQDILFKAQIHPKRKIESFTTKEKTMLFDSIKNTLSVMVEKGGRNTEKNLFGNEGGYKTILSARTNRQPCPVCGAVIQKQAYLGGNIYFCPVCQPL